MPDLTYQQGESSVCDARRRELNLYLHDGKKNPSPSSVTQSAGRIVENR